MARGRPRKFDQSKVLTAALKLFWQHGYEGTSLAMLAKSMGLNMPSLYATFGSKEELFKRATEQYNQNQGAYFRAALGQPTARAVAEALMEGSIQLVTNPNTPCGCLLVTGGLASSASGEPARLVLRQMRLGAEAAITARFKQAVKDGDLPRGTDTKALAKTIFTFNLGAAIQAKDGATRADLRKAAKLVLAGWP